LPEEKLEITGDTKMYGDLKLSTGSRNIHVNTLTVITGDSGVELLTFDDFTETTMLHKPAHFLGADPEDRSIVVNGGEDMALKIRTYYGLDIMDVDTTTDAFALQMYADLSFTADMAAPKVILTPGLSRGLSFVTRDGIDLMSMNTTAGEKCLLTPAGPWRYE
jgi:hypothetical protein